MTTEASGSATSSYDSRRRSSRHSPASSADLKPSSTGRNERQAVRRYLHALQARPQEANPPAPEILTKRIATIDSQLADAEPQVKVALIHERMDLYARLRAAGEAGTLEQLEQEFIAVAGTYSARQGLTYAAWREVGVEDDVLERAGIAQDS